MASLDGRSLFVDPENPENDLKIISIDPELGRWGGVGLGATLAKISCIMGLPIENKAGPSNIFPKSATSPIDTGDER